MSLRRQLVPLALMAVASLSSACKMFRPVNPNAPAKTATAKPTATKDAPKADTKADAKTKTKATATKTAPAAPASKSVKEQRAGLTDPNIAAMVLALNNTDLSYAKLALRTAPLGAERADVRVFAQRMLTDHTGVNGLVNDLLGKLNVAPIDNTASLDMRDESANRRDAMRELTGFPFDSTYIENEVSYHVKFLATIDSVMIPVAKNADLKGLLVAVRPAVAAHLAHAEQVRANVLSRR